jgi:hypothetical protein
MEVLLPVCPIYSGMVGKPNSASVSSSEKLGCGKCTYSIIKIITKLR